MRIDRLNEMESYISVKGSASFEELASVFRISKNTVRRDVDEIIQKGRFEKTYGGVSVATSPSTVVSSPWASRRERAWDVKRQIAALAAELVHDNSCIFLDAGTTTFALLEYIGTRKNVTIITDSLPVMVDATKYPGLRVFALGGLYFADSSSFQGDSTVAMIQQLNADVAFIGTSAIALDCGLSNSTHYDAMLKRRVVARIPKIVLMTDSSKFDKRALFTFCDLDAVHTVVTDKMPAKAYCDYFAEHKIKLLVP